MYIINLTNSNEDARADTKLYDEIRQYLSSMPREGSEISSSNIQLALVLSRRIGMELGLNPSSFVYKYEGVDYYISESWVVPSELWEILPDPYLDSLSMIRKLNHN